MKKQPKVNAQIPHHTCERVPDRFPLRVLGLGRDHAGEFGGTLGDGRLVEELVEHRAPQVGTRVHPHLEDNSCQEFRAKCISERYLINDK